MALLFKLLFPLCMQVCLPSAPAAEPFSNTTASINNTTRHLLSVAPSPSTTSRRLASTERPPTPEWLLADDNKAPTTPNLLIALIASVLSALTALLGGFITYKICKARFKCCSNSQCCSNIKCCLCSL